MLKRILGFVLVLVLAAAWIPGSVSAQESSVCGTDQADVVITLAAGARGHELDMTYATVGRFMEACPNITVNVLQSPDLVDNRLGLYTQTLQAQATDIDVMQIDVTWAGILSEHLLDLTSYVSEDQLSAQFPILVQNSTINDQVLAVPLSVDAGLLYYRTDLLEKYGLSVPTTWEELQTAAQTIQDGERGAGNEDFWGYVWQGANYEGLTANAMEWQDGGTLIDAEGAIAVNNSAAVEGISRATGWIGTISPAGVLTFEEEEARTIWQSGNAAFMRNWTQAYQPSAGSDSPIKDVFSVTALPGGKPTLGGWEVAVSKYTQYPEAAAAFAIFMASADEQKIRAVQGGYSPAVTSLYEDSDVLEANSYMEAMPDIFDKTVMRPSSMLLDKYTQASVIYTNAVHSALAGEATAADALAVAESDLQTLLAQ